eukprot:CAMPEP_0172491018 /NCGR_PEP_ID=MMETSP1066-20121228/21672_1 /TAXON_ID=671091 /ORGANISM="Coscinodiscus wailesii, Strain CCMP2513" /LENGTH=643 /DNA_ID=CAMNT_0013259805 /DNA_START=121 /DNA_END=2052 /DNA_ORIENTATION=-
MSRSPGQLLTIWLGLIILCFVVLLSTTIYHNSGANSSSSLNYHAIADANLRSQFFRQTHQAKQKQVILYELERAAKGEQQQHREEPVVKGADAVTVPQQAQEAVSKVVKAAPPADSHFADQPNTVAVPPPSAAVIDEARGTTTDAKAPPPPDGNEKDHNLAGLSCAKYGGPSDEAASEMVYWSDIPGDSEFTSPFYNDGEEKYMTFEPDGGGWNNIRMAMETVVALAYAMGRTLVMPPEQRMYLLGKDRGKQKTHFSFADFFHLDTIATEHKGLKIISHEEFLQKMAMTGKLRDPATGKASFPPNNRTNWNGQGDMTPYKEYLRTVTEVRNWKPEQCLAAFPSHPGPDGIQRVNDILSDARTSVPAPEDYIDNPTPVDADPASRLREQLSGRKQFCVYDDEMQQAPVVHFMCYHKMRARLLTHFYTFLYFEDWKQDLWTKRFVRDHLRYLDEIQCAAARIVEAVRKRAREKHEGNKEGYYDSFHIRRGDFQYKATRIEADEIYENSKDELEEGATVYIATDERNKDFFAPMAEHYDLVFLDDYKHLLKGVNTNYYGMLDQLIASRGRIFFGTWYSTFTGYINRMRGYHAQKDKLEGFEKGLIQSYYFVTLANKLKMRQYWPLGGAHYAREFPVSWRDIDKGMN